MNVWVTEQSPANSKLSSADTVKLEGGLESLTLF